MKREALQFIGERFTKFRTDYVIRVILYLIEIMLTIKEMTHIQIVEIWVRWERVKQISVDPL